MNRLLKITLICLIVLFGAFTSIAVAAVSVTLEEQNNSGVSGTATLTEKGNQTEVVLNLNKQADGTKPMPAHIHTGVCNANPQVTYPLQPVVNGTSTTLVNAPLSEIQSTLRSIQVHKSQEEIAIYVACANLQQMTQLPKTGDSIFTAISQWILPGMIVLLVMLGVGLRMQLKAQTRRS